MNTYQQDQLTRMLESRPIEPVMIDDFFKRNKHRWRIQDIKKAYAFLLEYANQIEKQEPDIADTLRAGYQLSFENKAREGVMESIRQIVKIPDDTKIDPKFLNGISNHDFVMAFATLQEFLLDCYHDIARAPFEWGYPASHKKFSTGPAFYGDSRLRRMISTLFSCGEFDGHVLTVDKKAFLKNVYQSTSKETALMLEGFANMGLMVEGFDDKSESLFYISFPDNANVLAIFRLFFSDGECRKCADDCSHMGSCYWNYPVTKNTSFSYRFFEDRVTQTHEPEFLIVLDYMADNLREIHFWLYEEAKKCGFDFDHFDATAYGNMLYRKGGWGTKNMPLVGVYDIAGDRLEENKFMAHTTFKRIFKTHPEEIAKLMEKFPDAIGNHAYDCPSYCDKTAVATCKRVHQYKMGDVEYHSCGYQSFLFMEPTFDDVKLIIELWKLENRIK